MTDSAASSSALASAEKELEELERTPPIRPRVPSILLTDATPEALLRSLATDWPSAAIASARAVRCSARMG